MSTTGMDELGAIKPFLSHLHQVHLEPLQTRADFPSILKTKYQEVHTEDWLPDFLITAVKHIEEQLSRAKTQLLDHKPASIK